MGQSSSKTPQSIQPKVCDASLTRAKTMIDISHAQIVAIDQDKPVLTRSSSDTTLNNSMSLATVSEQKSYQQALEWGRNEHFFKLAHAFHTNNY